LDLGKLRDAMTFGAPETEALYEGYAQKGFGFLSIDGSPVPLGSTATHEPIGISISPWGRWKSPDDHRDVITSLWIKKHSNTNKLISMTINDHRGQAVLGMPFIRI
ncbi:MAG: hypothetical protein ACO2O0_10090, partial [Desulfurococcales archaeon]